MAVIDDVLITVLLMGLVSLVLFILSGIGVCLVYLVATVLTGTGRAFKSRVAYDQRARVPFHVMKTLKFWLPRELARSPTAVATNVEARLPDGASVDSIGLSPNGRKVEVTVVYQDPEVIPVQPQ